MNSQYLYNVEDPLNLTHMRNEINTLESRYNCFGYAFKTYSWLVPYKTSFYQRVLGMIYEEYTLDEIYDCCLKEFTNNIIEDFNGIVEAIDSTTANSLIKNGKEVMAFRLGANYTEEPLTWETYDEEDLMLDVDFHFRVFRDGKWREKMGDGSPCIASLNSIWDGSTIIYDSPIVYFKWTD